MLSTKHIKIKRPFRKLDHKFLGHFQINKIISPTAVRLILPGKQKTHPSFHISEIEPLVPGNRPVPDFTKILREVSDIEADKEYNVDEIKGSINHRNKILYHVKWLGYPRRRIGHSNHTKISQKVVEKNYTKSTSTTRINLRIAAYPTEKFNHRSSRGHWPWLIAEVSQHLPLQWRKVSNTHTIPQAMPGDTAERKGGQCYT